MTPADLRVALDAGLASLGLSLSPAQQNQLLQYLALLQKWNRVYNLTALRDPDQMLTHHLLDCLAVLPLVARQLGQRVAPANSTPPRLLDVGSGGGLPGVVLAIGLPQLQVECVDTVAKKAAFIQQVAAELGLPNLRGVHARVENLQAQPYDVICSRAFSSLADLVQLSKALLRPETGVWMAMKGKHPADELAALPPDAQVFHVEPLQVPGLDAERCMIWVRLKR